MAVARPRSVSEVVACRDHPSRPGGPGAEASAAHSAQAGRRQARVGRVCDPGARGWSPPDAPWPGESGPDKIALPWTQPTHRLPPLHIRSAADSITEHASKVVLRCGAFSSAVLHCRRLTLVSVNPITSLRAGYAVHSHGHEEAMRARESHSEACSIHLIDPHLPRLAVEGRSYERTRADAPHLRRHLYVKPMLLPHGGWPMAAGPVSRLGSLEPGDKTGLRLSPT